MPFSSFLGLVYPKMGNDTADCTCIARFRAASPALFLDAPGFAVRNVFTAWMTRTFGTSLRRCRLVHRGSIDLLT